MSPNRLFEGELKTSHSLCLQNESPQSYLNTSSQISSYLEVSFIHYIFCMVRFNYLNSTDAVGTIIFVPVADKSMFQIVFRSHDHHPPGLLPASVQCGAVPHLWQHEEHALEQHAAIQMTSVSGMSHPLPHSVCFTAAWLQG